MFIFYAVLKNIYLLYLAIPGLSCSTQDLQSSLQHSESFISLEGNEPIYWRTELHCETESNLTFPQINKMCMVGITQCVKQHANSWMWHVGSSSLTRDQTQPP